VVVVVVVAAAMAVMAIRWRWWWRWRRLRCCGDSGGGGGDDGGGGGAIIGIRLSSGVVAVREGEEMARAEVAAMMVAEVATAGRKVVFHTAHRPDVPQHGWLGLPGGEQGSGVDIHPQHRWHEEHIAQPSTLVAVVAQMRGVWNAREVGFNNNTHAICRHLGAGTRHFLQQPHEDSCVSAADVESGRRSFDRGNRRVASPFAWIGSGGV
jgi:hypothetical protein